MWVSNKQNENYKALVSIGKASYYLKNGWHWTIWVMGESGKYSLMFQNSMSVKFIYSLPKIKRVRTEYGTLVL